MWLFLFVSLEISLQLKKIFPPRSWCYASAVCSWANVRKFFNHYEVLPIFEIILSFDLLQSLECKPGALQCRARFIMLSKKWRASDVSQPGHFWTWCLWVVVKLDPTPNWTQHHSRWLSWIWRLWGPYWVACQKSSLVDACSKIKEVSRLVHWKKLIFEPELE